MLCIMMIFDLSRKEGDIKSLLELFKDAEIELHVIHSLACGQKFFDFLHKQTNKQQQ